MCSLLSYKGKPRANAWEEKAGINFTGYGDKHSLSGFLWKGNFAYAGDRQLLPDV
jgi:hypothetical protein